MAPIPAATAVLPTAPKAALRRMEWQIERAVNTTLSGDYRSAFRGRGMEFDQVVKYQWGDDLRDIDWNVTARLGEPYRKKFVEERELSLIFVFEDSPALQFGSGARTRRESLLEVAALLMLLASVNRDRVGLFYSSPVASWYQRPMAGRKSTLRMASRLLDTPPPPLDVAPDCALPWRMIRRAASNGSVILWFGAFMPTETPEGWRVLQQRCQTIGVRADDAWDDALPECGRLAVYDPVAGRVVNLDPASRAERHAHAQWRVWRDAYFSRLFPTPGGRLAVRNDEDLLQSLIAYFRRHKQPGARG
ncbi:DUF58 domain-containing protein [Solimonas flava]|uniref:DUF58 domain-containing protein n=1 Tax=Solimonas flava TaxID=415849 RepID=UPI000402F2BD|nr:DUF58 domain-containing protein [Solimonas flava]